MKIYLVGGAVRDQLLGLPVKEKDWVVVGSTPEELLSLGYQAVGKEFPVFLHPETHEEYALARTERKVGRGYKGFVFYADPSVTLEEDLARRDLTINAMAEDKKGNLIDPFNGLGDLKAKIFRHVSKAFEEDPVRILRLARFAARFPEFIVHPDTRSLMKKMVSNGEVDALVPERVWQELARALQYAAPQRFFSVLQECGALQKLFPEVSLNLPGLAKMPLSNSPLLRLATLTYSLQQEAIITMSKRFRFPNNYKELMLLVAKFGNSYNYLDLNDPNKLLDLLTYTDAFRRHKRFNHFLEVCHVCFEKDYIDLLQKALKAAESVSTVELQNQNLQGKEFAKALHQLRLDAIAKVL